MIEGRLEVKLPTIWTDGKAEMGRVREEKRREEERSRCAKREEVVMDLVAVSTTTTATLHIAPPQHNYSYITQQYTDYIAFHYTTLQSITLRDS